MAGSNWNMKKPKKILHELQVGNENEISQNLWQGTLAESLLYIIPNLKQLPNDSHCSSNYPSLM